MKKKPYQIFMKYTHRQTNKHTSYTYFKVSLSIEHSFISFIIHNFAFPLHFFSVGLL